MKTLTSDQEWAIWVFAGTPQHLRFVIEPTEKNPASANTNTRQYAFADDATQALVLKGYSTDISSALIEEAIATFKRGDGEPLSDR